MALGIAGSVQTTTDDVGSNFAMISSAIRRINLLIPHVTVEEVRQDALGISGYPVETGATLTDHSFKLPARLEMTVGWSDSSAGASGYCQEIYDKLLSLQATRQPFEIFTGRRVYRNMLMEAMVDVSNVQYEYAMLPRITFRELLISRTQTASAASAQPATSNADQMMPEKTGSVVDMGTVQPQLVNFSGNNGTAYGGYDPSLAVGSTTGVGDLGTMQVQGVGSFDASGLGETTETTDPGALGGNAGLFGRYNPQAFTDVQPFRI